MDPGNLPGGLRIGRREDFETAGRVGGNEVAPGGAHRGIDRVARAEGLAGTVEGLSCWTDAALLTAAGIPAICFGPGDISLAHAAEEYVPLAEIDQATAVLTRVVTDWCGPKGVAWGS